MLTAVQSAPGSVRGCNSFDHVRYPRIAGGHFSDGLGMESPYSEPHMHLTSHLCARYNSFKLSRSYGLCCSFLEGMAAGGQPLASRHLA